MNTRIAPSPTGFAHIGFARTAYVNYIAAKSTGGQFIVRIDDTDKERSKKEYEDSIIKCLDWLGIKADNLFRQSERAERYKEVVDDLLSKEVLHRDDSGAISLISNYTIDHWDDSILGRIDIPEKLFDNQVKSMVLVRPSGDPVYHLASVIDDIDFDIDWVIRGNDHLTNTSKHVYIYDAMSAQLPKFTHLGLIFSNGKKISKRDNLFSMDEYDQYNPSAVKNALLKLGWSHKDANIDKIHPLIDTDLAIQLFDEGNLRCQKSSIDVDKLKWLDKKYNNLK